MNDEIELAAKAIGESVGALAEQSGVLGPVHEMADWLKKVIHYRSQPRLAKLLMNTARKVQATGIPPHAVPDKVLRAILEGASLEDEPTMQERWANLLTSAVTGTALPPAYPRILSELEPIEARALDFMIGMTGESAGWGGTARLLGNAVPGLDNGHIDNLVRLGLVRYLAEDYTGPGVDIRFPEPTLGSTVLASRFVAACSEPKYPGSTTDAP